MNKPHSPRQSPAKTAPPSDVKTLQARLQEAEDTLEAIRNGYIDALVVTESDRQQIYTLKSADRSYRLLIESMNQAALTITQDGTILYANKICSTMFNTELSQIIGGQLPDFFRPEDKAGLQQLIKTSQPSSKTLNAAASHELEMEIPGQQPKSVIISATVLPSSESNIYMGFVITDITERKRAERAKDEFIALASHQLRTPATGVKQYLGLLLEGYVGELSERDRVYIQTAYDSNERQLTIINDILKTAQIDSGMYQLEKTVCHVGALVTEVVAEYQPIFKMRGQKVVCDIDHNFTAEVDTAELYLVIANLLENASKYSAESTTIRIKVHKTAKNACISITDEGVGILEADQEQIFEKFTRINNAVSDTVNGTGLGLYWVKRIVELHKGKISVSSTVNAGSTFKVDLPLK